MPPAPQGTYQTGRARAFAHLLLGEAADVPGEEARLELALAEAGDDPEVGAFSFGEKADLLVVSRVDRSDEAEDWAQEALSHAGRAGAEIEDRAVLPLAWPRVLRGRPIDDLGGSEATSRAREVSTRTRSIGFVV